MSNRVFIDIKPPTPGRDKSASKMNWPGDYQRFKKEIKRARFAGKLKMAFTALSVVLMIGGAVFAFQAVSFRQRAPSLVADIHQSLKQFGESLLALETEKADSELALIKDAVSDLEPPFLIKQAGRVKEIFAALTSLIRLLGEVNGDLAFLKENALSLAIGKEGEMLIEKLKVLSANVKKINDIGNNLKGEDFLAASSEIQKIRQFLENITAWLNRSRSQNLILLFQNPSEIRPAGGFAGSYAEVVLSRSSLADMRVNDIYDPDGQLDLRMAPPKPLQLITTWWGARDANWFFDFPTSAEKVLNFLEKSKIYSERSMEFSGLLALNVNVTQSLLDLTGPIELPDYGLTIDKNNFLAEVQREVEAGRDKKAGEPKRILKVMMPIFLDKLGRLGAQDKDQLIELIKKHAANKDIMVYFRDSYLQGDMRSFGLAGEVFEFEQNFNGDYLAVVNANIGGGKSDAFVEQNIRWESKIDLSGNAANRLVFERRHNGANRKEWWYRSTNKNFVQVFASPDANLISVKGNTRAGIEELAQFGKKTFAAWLDVPAGKSKKLELEYETAEVLTIVKGAKYQFVFDKQSGVNGGLELSIEAPAGYKWKESGKQTFNYQTSEIPKRLILNLTLAESQ